MQTSHSPRSERPPLVAEESGISLRDFFRVIREYRPVIAVVLAGVLIGYAILAIAFYVSAPATRLTSQQFRLNFEGATEGRYPNGLKFSPVEIVSAPILQKVYQRNELSRFMSLDDFSRSMFVLESNPAYDALAREYEARLADPKLTPIDRDRIQREFDMKRAALSKNMFSLNFQHNQATSRVPESTIRSVLVDTMNVWADVAVNEQHVVDYRVSVLSPEVIGGSVAPQQDYVPTLIALHSQMMDVLENIAKIRDIPGAELAKSSDRLTLDELRIRLDEMLRFRVDPLMAFVAEKHLVRDPQTTLRFAQNQLDYDQRQLDAKNASADAIRQTLAVYAQRPAADRTVDASTLAKPSQSGEALMPQISEGFLDRLLDLSTRAADANYRQTLAMSYRVAAQETIPLASAVAYDKSVIEILKSNSGGGANPADDAYVRTSIESVRNDVRQLIAKVNEVYKTVSSTLRPSTQLFTMTSPAVVYIERTTDLKKLMLGGILVELIAFVMLLGAVLLHSRLRREPDAEESLADAAQPVSSPALP